MITICHLYYVLRMILEWPSAWNLTKRGRWGCMRYNVPWLVEVSRILYCCILLSLKFIDIIGGNWSGSSITRSFLQLNLENGRRFWGFSIWECKSCMTILNCIICIISNLLGAQVEPTTLFEISSFHSTLSLSILDLFNSLVEAPVFFRNAVRELLALVLRLNLGLHGL